MRTGVYTFTNSINGKLYVGSTINSFVRRRNQHLYLLRRGTHSNGPLQEAYKIIGEANLIFEILEECHIAFCRSQEQYWSNLLQSYNSDYGYNIGGNVKNRQGAKCSLESKRKMAVSQLKYRGVTSKEEIEEHFKKKSTPKLTKDEVRALSSKRNSGKGNPMYGKKPTPRKVCKLSLDGQLIEIYNSGMEAQRKNNLKNLSRALKTGSTAGNYKWIYFNENNH
jgi:group I intron endonuclease